MKPRADYFLLSYATGIAALISCVWLLSAFGAVSPTVQRLTNGDVRIEHSASAGQYRIDTSADLKSWDPLVTLVSSGLIQHVDSAAGYYPQRFYRISQVTGSSVLTGDHLTTKQGDIVFHPINHASFVMSWNGKMIYSDPVGAATLYSGIQKADLILVTHTHSDHFSSSTIDSVRATGARIVAPQAVYNSMSAAQKKLTTVLTNGANTSAVGVNIAAVPAYNLTNTNHVQGVGNGYVLTIAGRRIFISGDTEDVPEIRALTNIDVAFLCMNVPFTMNIAKAASTVRQMKPKVVYPYHYRNSDNTYADLVSFRQQVGTDLGIEVRARTWY